MGNGTPKPLIEVAGKPMIAWALESLSNLQHSRIIFVALAEHEKQFGLRSLLSELAGSTTELVLLDSVTEGQLCTVLTARHLIEPDKPLLIASSDTYVISDLAADIEQSGQDCHGLISVANAPGDHWSFARTDENGDVVEVTEKKRISDNASTGLYYFSNAGEFLDTADSMIEQRDTTRGEYYVMPLYQRFIDRGWKIKLSLAREVWDMGTPEALNEFLRRRVTPQRVEAN